MPIIEIHQLRKTFGSVTAVADVSFSVEPGEIFGILGPNGAGKTTTVECLTGMQRPSGGRITVLDHDPAEGGAHLRGLIGYQLQSSELPENLRVGEALNLFAAFYPSPRPTPTLLDLVGLTHKRRAAFGKLSGGEKQRLSIALALVGDPQIAFLDELTTGLDPQGRRDMWRLVEDIRQTGVTVVLVSHLLDEVERLCDRLTVIDHGRSIFVGTSDELRASTADARAPWTLEDAYVALIDDQFSRTSTPTHNPRADSTHRKDAA